MPAHSRSNATASSNYSRLQAKFRRRKSSKGAIVSSHVDVQVLILFALVVAAVCALVGSVLLQAWSAEETVALERQHVVSSLLKDGAIQITKGNRLGEMVASSEARRKQKSARAKRLRASSGRSAVVDVRSEVEVAEAMKYSTKVQKC